MGPRDLGVAQEGDCWCSPGEDCVVLKGMQAWSCLKDFRFSCISSSSRFAGRGVLPDSCQPVPQHLQGVPELRGTGPNSVTSLCFSSVPGVPRHCCMAAGVDALSPCETSYTCARKVGGGDMCASSPSPAPGAGGVSDLSTEPKRTENGTATRFVSLSLEPFSPTE